MIRTYSPELAEMMAVNALLCYIKKYKERTERGEINPEEECGYRASLIEDMISIFYRDRRSKANITVPTENMTNQELAEFILDEALYQIAEDNPLFLKRGWDGNYRFVTDDIF